MYFNKFNRINYTIDGKEYELLNIFTRVSFLFDFTSPEVFDFYTIQEGESPEDVANIVYGDTALSWFVILQNNIVSDDEWYGGDIKFNTLVNQYYAGESYYITNLPDAKEGDLLVKVTAITAENKVSTIDSTIYRIVKQFDKTFRCVWGLNGTGSFSVNDNIAIARKDENGNISFISFTSSDDVTKQTEVATLKFIEKRTNSPIHFLNVANDATVPPNTEFDGTILSGYIPPNTIYTDIISTSLNFANTLLYYYMTNSGNAPNIRKHTYYKDFFNKYYARQTIRVMKPTYAGQVVNRIRNLITSNAIGERITLES